MVVVAPFVAAREAGAGAIGCLAIGAAGGMVEGAGVGAGFFAVADPFVTAVDDVAGTLGVVVVCLAVACGTFVMSPGRVRSRWLGRRFARQSGREALVTIYIPTSAKI